LLITVLDIDVEQYDKDQFAIISQNILNLIEFESPRFLIQEVSNDILKV